MTPSINFSELYNSGGTFARQEVIEVESGDATVTTIYGGYAPDGQPTAETDDKPTWSIRRLVVTDYEHRQDIQCTWARGSWTNRASLDYQYYRQ